MHIGDRTQKYARRADSRHETWLIERGRSTVLGAKHFGTKCYRASIFYAGPGIVVSTRGGWSTWADGGGRNSRARRSQLDAVPAAVPSQSALRARLGSANPGANPGAKAKQRRRLRFTATSQQFILSDVCLHGQERNRRSLHFLPANSAFRRDALRGLGCKSK